MTRTSEQREWTRVAVVMRTRDRPLLLARALRDVVAQDFTDWQLTIVNDGGAREPVAALVAGLPAAVQPRVAVVHHEEPRGMEAATNSGLAASSSEFVCIHDDDDTWDPRFLSVTVRHLDAFPADAAVVVRTEIVLEEIRGERVVELGRKPFWSELPAITLFDLIRTNRFVPISLLYRRAVHDSIGPFNEDLQVVGDWEFHLKLTQHFRVGLVDQTLAFWHQRPAQSGVLGNSVLVAEREHDRADLLLREQALKDHVARNGMGDLLYLTRYLQGEFDQLQRRITSLERFIEDRDRKSQDRAQSVEEAVREAGLVAFLRRKWYTLRARLH